MYVRAMAQRTQAEKTPVDKALQAFARTKLGGKLFISAFPAIDKRLMPLTRGRLRVGIGQPILLLHARGAKSGQPRTTPLLYCARGDQIILVASKAGAEHNPAWYHNLVAHPEVEVEIVGKRRAVRSREAQGAEREKLWRFVNDVYNGYEVYATRTGGRQIPVMVLEPR